MAHEAGKVSHFTHDCRGVFVGLDAEGAGGCVLVEVEHAYQDLDSLVVHVFGPDSFLEDSDSV